MNIKNLIFYFLWALILALMPLLSYSADKKYGSLYHVEYIDNYDGDTITFNIPNIHPIIGDKITVRVFGIDTPEISGACEKEKEKAKIVKHFVKDFLLNAKVITLTELQRDKYFRLLAKVIVDEKDLSEVLINSKLAVSYFGVGKKQDWCE